MEQRLRDSRRNAALLFSFALLFSATTAHFQVLIVNPLRYINSTLYSARSDSKSVAVEPEAKGTLSLQLDTFDDLRPPISQQDSFTLRLERDALRVQVLADLASATTRGRAPPRNRTGASTGFNSSVISGLAQGSGDYFTRVGIGTPSRYFYMVMDTGSDLSWVQCAPCLKCYNQTDPIFNPSKSRSFADVPCSSPLCPRRDSRGCKSKKCHYNVFYGDGSFSRGELSIEMLTFRDKALGPIAFGCGHDNEGLFAGASGLLGLGRGKCSLLGQAGHWFNKTFSYCLVDRYTSSKGSWMIFGNSAVSQTAKFTPLLANPKLHTFYYVELLGISVGGARVKRISPGLFKIDEVGNGGVIIDSGTAVTRLTQPAYVALRNAFRVGASKLKRAPGFLLFDTCYDLRGRREVKVPAVVLHFQGVNMSLPATNYMIPVDTNGTFCFAFAGTNSTLSIIGNIQQQGFRVVFDLKASRVGFAPKGCA